MEFDWIQEDAKLGLLLSRKPEITEICRRFGNSSFLPKSSCSFTGLQNQGATCYLNCLLQSLFMIPEFRHAVCSIPNSSNYNSPIPIQLQSLFSQLLLTKRKSVSTKKLTDSFGWTNSDVFDQQDVHELNRVLIDAISEADVTGELGNVLRSLFEFVLCESISCVNCNHIRLIDETCMDLQLSLFTDEQMTIDGLLLKYQSPETLDEDNQWKCGNCLQTVCAIKQARFKIMPKLLTIHLKRFIFDATSFKRQKLCQDVVFGTKLTIPSNNDNDDDDDHQTYDLVSIICHFGSSPFGGHYKSVCREIVKDDDDGGWICFDDENTSVFHISDLPTLYSRAYMLIYRSSSSSSLQSSENSREIDIHAEIRREIESDNDNWLQLSYISTQLESVVLIDFCIFGQHKALDWFEMSCQKLPVSLNWSAADMLTLVRHKLIAAHADTHDDDDAGLFLSKFMSCNVCQLKMFSVDKWTQFRRPIQFLSRDVAVVEIAMSACEFPILSHPSSSGIWISVLSSSVNDDADDVIDGYLSDRFSSRFQPLPRSSSSSLTALDLINLYNSSSISSVVDVDHVVGVCVHHSTNFYHLPVSSSLALSALNVSCLASENIRLVVLSSSSSNFIDKISTMPKFTVIPITSFTEIPMFSSPSSYSSSSSDSIREVDITIFFNRPNSILYDRSLRVINTMKLADIKPIVLEIVNTGQSCVFDDVHFKRFESAFYFKNYDERLCDVSITDLSRICVCSGPCPFSNPSDIMVKFFLLPSSKFVVDLIVSCDELVCDVKGRLVTHLLTSNDGNANDSDVLSLSTIDHVGKIRFRDRKGPREPGMILKDSVKLIKSLSSSSSHILDGKEVNIEILSYPEYIGPDSLILRLRNLTSISLSAQNEFIVTKTWSLEELYSHVKKTVFPGLMDDESDELSDDLNLNESFVSAVPSSSLVSIAKYSGFGPPLTLASVKTILRFDDVSLLETSSSSSTDHVEPSSTSNDTSSRDGVLVFDMNDAPSSKSRTKPHGSKIKKGIGFPPVSLRDGSCLVVCSRRELNEYRSSSASKTVSVGSKKKASKGLRTANGGDETVRVKPAKEKSIKIRVVGNMNK